jgi:hypothetical protein
MTSRTALGARSLTPRPGWGPLLPGPTGYAPINHGSPDHDGRPRSRQRRHEQDGLKSRDESFLEASAYAQPFYSRDDVTTPRVAGLGYEIRQLKDIDCVLQNFYADFSIIYHWYAPELVGMPEGNAEPSILDEVDRPQVMIANEVDLEEKDVDVRVLNTNGLVQMEVVYTGVLSEFMELDLFPLDIQDLSVVVRSKMAGWHFKPLKDPGFRRVTASVASAEWLVAEPQMTVSVNTARKCTWRLRMKVMRKSSFYESNVMAVVGSLSTITVFSSLFPYWDWESRSNFITTLLLTAVTFKFVVGKQMPKVSFFTILDIYLLFSNMFMVALMAEAAALKLLVNVDMIDAGDGMFVDLCFMSGMMFLWIFGNIWYYWRYRALMLRQTDLVGPLVKDITTNFETQGAMSILMGNKKVDD